MVESDRHGQIPFMYVIMGDDKCILIDSGCGMYLIIYCQYFLYFLYFLAIINLNIPKNHIEYVRSNERFILDNI